MIKRPMSGGQGNHGLERENIGCSHDDTEVGRGHCGMGSHHGRPYLATGCAQSPRYAKRSSRFGQSWRTLKKR